jgi:hypothetical protein
VGLIRGEWLFTTSTPPGLKEIAEAFAARTGLEVRCDDDTDPGWLDIPLLNESLFDLEYHPPDRVVLHSFIPAHPYLWTQLDKVMIGLGATASSDPCAWTPDALSDSLDRPWATLTRKQRFALRRRAIGGWRPFDFLLRNGGGKP